LGKLQRKAAIWILGVFKISSLYSIEAIAGLIPIHLHLQKLSERSQLRAHSLPTNHILRSLMGNDSNVSNISSHPHHHLLLLNSLTKHQCGLIKGHIINMDNRFNKVFPLFDSLNPEFCFGNKIIDNFSNCFSFHLFAKSSDRSFKLRLQQLDALTIESSISVTNTLMIIDASVRNNVMSSIAYIHVHNKPVVKTLHHAVNITSIEAEFFALCCDINQASYLYDISKIIIITDSIHAAKKIFITSSHPLQKQSASISRDLREFFNCHSDNGIEFWECPSKSNWHLYKAVNMDTKFFYLTPLFSNKLSWDFSKKVESNSIINKYKIMFQVSDLKGRSFLDLIDSDDSILEPSYCKGSTWLKYFGHSNMLCARAMRALTNHAPIEEYQLHFFPNEVFSCPCGLYPIESR